MVYQVQKARLVMSLLPIDLSYLEANWIYNELLINRLALEVYYCCERSLGTQQEKCPGAVCCHLHVDITVVSLKRLGLNKCDLI